MPGTSSRSNCSRGCRDQLIRSRHLLQNGIPLRVAFQSQQVENEFPAVSVTVEMIAPVQVQLGNRLRQRCRAGGHARQIDENRRQVAGELQCIRMAVVLQHLVDQVARDEHGALVDQDIGLA